MWRKQPQERLSINKHKKEKKNKYSQNVISFNPKLYQALTFQYQINHTKSFPRQHFSLIYNNRVNKTPSKVFEPNKPLNKSHNKKLKRVYRKYTVPYKIIQKLLNRTSIYFKSLYSLTFKLFFCWCVCVWNISDKYIRNIIMINRSSKVYYGFKSSIHPSTL